MTEAVPLDPNSIAGNARHAAQALALAPTSHKNTALEHMAQALLDNRQVLADANEADIQRAKDTGVPGHIANRLRFGEAKIQSRVRSLRKISALPDPVGAVFDTRRCANGMLAQRVRVPLGVILMIYEARPHVTVNAGAFCLKSGNASILRGGSEARATNAVLGQLWREALAAGGLPENAIQVIAGSHEEVGELLRCTDAIDLVIPRGGKDLITSVAEQSRVPVLKHFAGVCHVYIDGDADPARALNIAIDSKCLMPEVCNAMETLLVHQDFLPRLGAVLEAYQARGVRVIGCERTRAAGSDVAPATEEDWATEYLDMVVSVRVVDDIGQAIAHINGYGSHHTDVIVTDSIEAVRRFQAEVDSGVVLVNASTMFCDGESLGMGAEIGISTDRLHARGPMGLEELTTYKFLIQGEGHVMGQPVANENEEEG